MIRPLSLLLCNLLVLTTGYLLSSPTAPTLSFRVPATAYVNEVVLVDARGSTGVCKLLQPDKSPSVTIDFGDGYSQVLLAGGHAWRQAGTYTVRLTAKSCAGESAMTTATITVVEIPAAVGANVVTVEDTGNPTTNAANLQRALNVAAARNTTEQEIVLKAKSVYAGPITMPEPVGDKWITIRPESSLANDRVVPLDQLPTILALSSVNSNTPALRTPDPAPDNPAHHYRVIGVHVRKDDETKPASRLVDLGTDSGAGQNKISQIPHHFILDRMWFDGGVSATSEVTNGLRVYANSVTVVNSVLKEFRRVGTGVDAAAVSLASGQGPYAFNNNDMVATSENFNVSGGPTELNQATITNATTSTATLSTIVNLEVDQNIALPVEGKYSERYSTIVRSISGNNITFDPIPAVPSSGVAQWMATPSFIEFRGNWLHKPLSWWPKHPTWNGVRYQVKNLLEFKFGRYVVVDGCILENAWVQDQDYAVMLAVRDGSNSVASVFREVQFSNSIIRNAAKGISLQAGDPADPSQLQTDFHIFNVLFQNVGVNWDGTGAGHQFINFNPANDNLGDVVKLRRIFVNHNTLDNGTPDNANGAITDFGSQGGAIDSDFSNNLSQDCGYGIFSNLTFNFTQAVAEKFPGVNNWTRNVTVNINNHVYPPGNFTAAGSWPAQFIDYAKGDFTLATGHIGKNAGTDGKDIGVDMAVLRAATANTISGGGSLPSQPTPSPTPVPSPVPTPAPSPTPQCAMIIVTPILNEWSSGTLRVTITDAASGFTIKVTPSSGQLTVSPPSQPFPGKTSAIAEFQVSSKKKGANVLIEGPCGNRTVSIVVR